jgi:nucleoside-diphosphate-sugar epimerase
MSKTVFLTGTTGRIGKRVLPMLLKSGYRVKALVHNSTPEHVQEGDLELVKGDILDKAFVEKALAGCDMVCHLAASFDMWPPLNFEKENTAVYENIVTGTFNLLEAANRLDSFDLFLFASTDAVYNTGPRTFKAPITEDIELRPADGRFYAIAKILGEEMCRNYGKCYNLPWSVIRINWALEADELLRLYNYEFYEGDLPQEKQAELKERLGNRKAVFCPHHPSGDSVVDQIADPDDTAEGFFLALENFTRAKGEIFNISAPKPFNYHDHSGKIAQARGVPCECVEVPGLEPYEISWEKAGRLINYSPKNTMDKMIAAALSLES